LAGFRLNSLIEIGASTGDDQVMTGELSGHCCIITKGVLAMQQSGEASTSGTLKIMTTRASEGLPHGFWVAGWSRFGGPIA